MTPTARKILEESSKVPHGIDPEDPTFASQESVVLAVVGANERIDQSVRRDLLFKFLRAIPRNTLIKAYNNSYALE